MNEAMTSGLCVRGSKEGNFIDQKGQDAIEALRRVRDDPPCQPLPPRTNYTRHIRQLIRWISCSAFESQYDWLPESEARFTRMTASNPRLVEALRRVAEAQCHAVEVAQVAILWPDAIEKQDEGAEVARELTRGWDEVGSHVAQQHLG